MALIKYFQSHAKRAYSNLSCTPTDKKVEQAIAWIQSHGGRASAREVQMYKVAGMKSPQKRKPCCATWRTGDLDGSLRGQKEKSSSFYTLSTLNINL